MDTFLFLGGKEKSTLKEIEEMLGKETIDILTTSYTRGQSPSYGANYQKTGKPLMTVDELAVMDRNKCILQINGVRPFFSDKYDITAHPRYKELSDYDRKNEFNVEKYLKYLRRKPRYRVKPEDQVDEAYNAGTISEECMKTDGFMSISH